MSNDMCYIFHKAIEKLSFHIVTFMESTGDANKTKIKLYSQKRQVFQFFSSKIFKT